MNKKSKKTNSAILMIAPQVLVAAKQQAFNEQTIVHSGVDLPIEIEALYIYNRGYDNV